MRRRMPKSKVHTVSIGLDPALMLAADGRAASV